MGKKVVITGATGMVGGIVLQLCLQSNEIAEVIALVRKSTGIVNSKYQEIITNDFLNYDKYTRLFNNVDIVYYCLGAYTGSVSADEFRKINYDLPLALASAIHAQSPDACFCLLSGQGADRTENSKLQFARDKGAIENAIAAFNFNSFHTFRPGYIYPTNKRKEPNFLYVISRLVYPIIKLLGNNFSIMDQQLAFVLFTVGINGYEKEVLENKDMRMLLKNC